MKKVQLPTDFLLPDSDFFTGMGSVLNISGNYFEYATSKNEKEADTKALMSDWQNIGIDINNSIEENTDSNKSLKLWNA